MENYSNFNSKAKQIPKNEVKILLIHVQSSHNFLKITIPVLVIDPRFIISKKLIRNWEHMKMNSRKIHHDTIDMTHCSLLQWLQEEQTFRIDQKIRNPSTHDLNVYSGKVEAPIIFYVSKTTRKGRLFFGIIG